MRFEINLVVGSMICECAPSRAPGSIYACTWRLYNSMNIWFQELRYAKPTIPVGVATGTGGRRQSVLARTPAAEAHLPST